MTGNMPSNNDRIRVGDRATIYPRGKKRIYCADFWHEGKHQRVSLETRNKRIATQRAVTIDADLSGGKYSAPPPPIKIETAIDKYIAYLESESRYCIRSFTCCARPWSKAFRKRGTAGCEPEFDTKCTPSVPRWNV